MQITLQNCHYFVLPMIGDWHILKNTALALFKIYDPTGLVIGHELARLFHQGRTETSVVIATDIDIVFSNI